MKFVEMFAGIGGMSNGLENAGFECVGFAELDKFAHKAYNILHNEDGRKVAWKDVTEVDERDLLELRKRTGGIDLLAAGFPCQAFSIAGKRRGFEDTRGTLFFEVARWASILKPSYLLLENVKGLLNHNGGNTFETILAALDELGYDAEWQVLNSKNFGVPHNRERIFIVGYLRGTGRREIFPIRKKGGNTLNYVGMLDMKGDDSVRRVYHENGISPALTTMQGGNRQPKIITPINPSKEDGTQFYHQDRIFDENGIMPALTSIVQNVKTSYAIRKITPLECFRLQSFPDHWHTTLVEHGFSNSQLYKMAGNAVTSSVVEAIGRRIHETNVI